MTVKQAINQPHNQAIDQVDLGDLIAQGVVLRDHDREGLHDPDRGPVTDQLVDQTISQSNNQAINQPNNQLVIDLENEITGAADAMTAMMKESAVVDERGKTDLEPDGDLEAEVKIEDDRLFTSCHA